MLVFGAAVVINRNPVASALSLVVSFLGLAALFMSLDAYFLGIIQVLVYAGAVMVLFLFIIMLLNIRAEERRRINWVTSSAGIAVASPAQIWKPVSLLFGNGILEAPADRRQFFRELVAQGVLAIYPDFPARAGAKLANEAGAAALAAVKKLLA